MEYVILAVSLPLVVYALALVRRERPPAAPVSAPVVGSGLARRPYPWLVVLALLSAAGLFFSPLFTTTSLLGNLARLMVLCRYGLLTGLLLVGLVPLGLRIAPALLGGLFVLRARAHLFHVAWMSVLVGSMVVVVCGVEGLNAPQRYPGVCALGVPEAGRDLVRAAAVLVLALPVLLACLRCTREAALPPQSWRPAPWVAAGLAGVAAGFFLVVLCAAVQSMVLSPTASAPVFPLQGLGEWAGRQLGSPHTRFFYPLGEAVARLLAAAPGYTRPTEDGPRLAPGHAQLTLAVGTVLLVYLSYYRVMRASGFRAGHVPRLPALYDLLLLLLLLGFFFQGAAFALDLYWVPASLGVALLALALYWGFNSEHLFSLGWTDGAGGARAAASPEQSAAPTAAPTLKDVAAAWARPGERTLVAVAASGGGIQAAAWTARVLVGLHERYGDALTRSIRLLSAVSGGSVGAMYCLDAWPPGPGAEWAAPPPAGVPAADSVCGRAMASSLEATAWGLVFPDLLRVIAPFLVDRSDDRGTRIEQAWRAGLRRPGVRLSDWADRVRAGQMPVPVFNATVVETGQRFLASPVLGPAAPVTAAAQARQLVELYPGARPLLSTVVRLSATFPFVSPICRPEWSGREPWPEAASYHFADGGYVDNEGLVTLVEWLTALLDRKYLAERPFDRILLLRLVPFPAAAPAGASLNRGWVYSTAGPLLTVQNVRAASQQERNDLAVRLFTESAATQGVEVRSAVLRFELPSALSPPLSWMLTDPQTADVDTAWRWLVQHDPEQALATIDGWFAPRQP